MPEILIAIVVILHGLVHLWYFTLSQGLVEFKPEMGWSGSSWLFTNLIGDAATRRLASALFLIAAAGFVVGGIGLLIQQEWWRPVLLASAVLSTAVFILFWDGSLQRPVEKGLLGILINIGILIAALGLV